MSAFQKQKAGGSNFVRQTGRTILDIRRMFEKRNINNLSTEQLGQLFPIEIVPYDKNWPVLFLKERKRIQKILGEKIAIRIEHFGSTSIEGLAAKPSIDILVEIPSLTDELKEKIIKSMKGIGYHFIWRTDERVPYMNFVKGYTLNGLEGNVFHLHMADKKHSLWDRIYFRDYLRKHNHVAKEYEKLKIELADKFKFNREAYTDGKSDFVKKITDIAKNSLMTTRQMKNYSDLLKGGDLRSIGKVNDVVKEIKTQTDFDALFNELYNSDRKIVMRAADAIEKITVENSNYLSKHKKKILALFETAKNKELKWHLALLAPRIKLTAKEFDSTWQALKNWATSKNESKIVRVNSLQGLYDLLPQKRKLVHEFEIIINEIESENIPSIHARVKKLKTMHH